MQQVFLTVIKGARRRDLRGVFRVQTGSLHVWTLRAYDIFSPTPAANRLLSF